MTKQKIIFVLALGTSIVSLFLFCTMWHQHRREAPRDTVTGGKGFVITDEPTPILARPSRTSIGEKQRDEIRSLFDSVVVACSNLQYTAMYESGTSLLERVEHLTDKDYQYVGGSLFRLLYYETVSKNAPLSDFSSAEGFEARIRTDFAAIRLYGAIIQRRKDYNQFFHWIEAKELKRLRRYREKFVREGNDSCAKTADRMIDEWIDRIESPQGFTYVMALYYLECGRIWVPSPSEEWPPNWEKIRQRAVRQGVEPLVTIGYKPKWMDELMKTPEPEVYRVPTCY